MSARVRFDLDILFGNTVKFIPVAGAIGLDVQPGPDGRVDFPVWDTGIGIAEEDHAWLFRPFVQLEGGLAESQGGRITVTGAAGQGSRFKMTLPLG